MDDQRNTPAESDAKTVGLVFVGVLFAAVVTQILERSSADNVPLVGQTHLIVAAVVTITSWIGYHNSRNRLPLKIHVFNLPFLQFAIEMLHVYLYWLVATTSEDAKDPAPSAIPESLLIGAVFLLFVAWDHTVLAIRRSTKYGHIPKTVDRPERRRATKIVTAVVIVLVTLVVAFDPQSAFWVVAVDAALCACLFGHRALQYRVSKQ